MPVATYALSYKDTGSILSFCTMEKQKVVDQASANALRDQLVGTSLVIAVRTRSDGPFTIPAADLVVDEIQIADPLQLARDPYSFVISVPSGGTATFGDGTPKPVTQIINPNVTLTLSAANSSLKVVPSSIPGTKTNVYGILAGQGLSTASIQFPQLFTTLTFSGAALTLNTAYPLLFVGQGFSTTVGLFPAT